MRKYDRIAVSSALVAAIVMNVPAPGAETNAPARAAPELPPALAAPAKVNKYTGMQEREEVFSFSDKPKVRKTGDRWTISFGSKGKCDATVSILGADGKIVRHLASGVLGSNAPWPFQQDSLSQKLEWDGLKDDFTKADLTGCVVRVSLGLQAKYEKDLVWAPGKWNMIEKDGKYFRTVFPPPASTSPEIMATLAGRLGTTKWGDKIPVGGWFSSFGSGTGPATGEPAKKAGELVKPLIADKEPPRKINFEPTKTPHAFGAVPRIFVDPLTDDLYWITAAGTPGSRVMRYNGRTGQFDPKFNNGGNGPWWNVSYIAFGSDGNIYLTCGGSGGQWFIIRVNRNWEYVKFTDKTETRLVQSHPKIPGDVMIPDTLDFFKNGRSKGMHDLGPQTMAAKEIIWTGENESGNIHDPGFAVGQSGLMVLIAESLLPAWRQKHGAAGGANNQLDKMAQIWTTEGSLLSANAIGISKAWGMGVSVDRDGNMYLVIGDTLPAGQKMPWGITDVPGGARVFGGCGSLAKFQYLGAGKYGTREGVSLKTGPTTDVKALWAFGGVSGQMGADCNCGSNLHGFDGWARTWVPARQLCSVVALDSNGNLIGRFGRYGNIDDADPAAGGIHLACPRGAAVSDSGLYVVDSDQNRILKAALTYAAEESVKLD